MYGSVAVVHYFEILCHVPDVARGYCLEYLAQQFARAFLFVVVLGVYLGFFAFGENGVDYFFGTCVVFL